MDYKGPVPEFTVVLRGYDRAAVDALTAWVDEQLAEPPADRTITPEELRTATFPVRWFGFDRKKVDHYLAELADLLERRSAES
ncbi:MAG: DivIVA domain-containing protein [Micromonosporaceae bacterium]